MVPIQEKRLAPLLKLKFPGFQNFTLIKITLHCTVISNDENYSSTNVAN